MSGSEETADLLTSTEELLSEKLYFLCSLSFKIHIHTAQKMRFSIKDFCSKCDEIRSFLQIWSHLLEKSLMENFIFCAVSVEHAIPKRLTGVFL